MVIDDDQNIVNVFCEILNIVGVDVVATGNDGNDAAIMYKMFHPDISFIDLNMPRYDGFYAIEEIRDMDLNTKIIAMTGYSEYVKSNIFDSLNISIINKPFDIRSIKQIIVDSFLIESDLSKTSLFKIRYKFKEDNENYLCKVTYEQYRNLKKIPMIEECEIVDNFQKNIDSYQNKMQKALDLASKDDFSYIKMISEIVPQLQ
ncbi:response regulator [Nitrosopumilus ureiphilus]|nr:response regulator [Nitrosopumilus ureiphilus]